ncbi:hypothetical protein BJY04DRAFT_199374 [Aspergillus karnatakaensis]|uniref:bZIP transcription factor n=1 Tax=Aspergillus karnatakaensis TaxID=1810916 RepID=UPI003CCCE4B4
METPRKTQKTTKLTGDRAARKREQDRQAQRSAREKTKKLIAHLESRIETLTRFHSSGNVQELIDELDKQRKANEALRSTLRSIEKAINGGLAEANTVLKNYNDAKTGLDDGSTSADSENSRHVSSNGHTQQSNLMATNHHSHIPQQSASPSFEDSSIIDKFSPNGTFVNLPDGLSMTGKTPEDVHVPFNSTLHTFPMDMPMPIQAVVHSTEPPCDCCKQLLYMNEMLGRFALSCTRTMADQRIRDSDIAIRAVVQGWDAVGHLYPLDPVWNMLRTADEAVWRTCGAVERVAVLRVVSLMLRYLSDPSENNLSHLPRFMRQRPSQHRIVHKPLIDFVVWPALRERLILYPHQHCSEKFWSMFWTCFRFIWPYRLQDTFVQQGQTGMYRFSDAFTKCFYNLDNWTMTPDFLREFPDLEPDVNVIDVNMASPPVTVDGELGLANGITHDHVSRLDPVAANMFTAFPGDWSTGRNPMF